MNHPALLLAGTMLAACLSSPALAQRADPDIIVTAQPDPEDPPVVAKARARLARTPGSVSVVAAESVQDRLVVGMPDLLRDVPGVLSNKRYGEESRLSIRGSGISQGAHQRGVLLAQDGVPFADADGFSDFQKIDPLGARYIEVYKGGNALRFGGAQLGGAINLVTPTGRTAASPFLFRLEGGSFGTARANVAVAGTAGDFDGYGSFNAFRSEGYRERSALQQVRGTLNLGYRIDDRGSEIRVIGYTADIRQEAPGALTLSQALVTPRNANAGALAGRWARDQIVNRATVQTRLVLNDDVTFEGGIYATATDLFHPVSIVIDQQGATQGAFGRFDIDGTLAGRRVDLFIGAAYRSGSARQQTFANIGGQRGARIGSVRQEASGLDIFAEGRLFVIDSLALVAGGTWGRADRDYTNRLVNTGDTRDYTWFAPRIGLLFERGDTQVYANLTRSVEPPTFGALVQSGFSSIAFVPLDTQRAWTGEVGTRGRSGVLAWDMTFYRAHVRGELLSFTPAAGLPASLFNADRTIHQGVEVSLDWHIVKSLRLRQTLAWSDFRFDGDALYGDNRLPVIPQVQYRVGMRYDHGSGAFVEPFLDWRIRPVFVDYANTLRAPGYAVVSVSAGVALKGGVSLFVDARNLLDTRHVTEFAAVTDARIAQTAVFYPGDGRTLNGGVRFRF